MECSWNEQGASIIDKVKNLFQHNLLTGCQFNCRNITLFHEWYPLICSQFECTLWYLECHFLVLHIWWHHFRESLENEWSHESLFRFHTVWSEFVDFAWIPIQFYLCANIHFKILSAKLFKRNHFNLTFHASKKKRRVFSKRSVRFYRLHCFLSQKTLFSKSEKSIFQVRKRCFPRRKTIFSDAENKLKWLWRGKLT